jgi:hypothetical protein
VIKLFEFVRRAPGLSQDEFRAAWIDHGGNTARRALRYVQNHAIPGAAVPGLTLSDFDCADELWFADVEELTAAPPERAGADLVDPAATIRLVAEESIQFDRGFGKVKFIGLSRRSAEFATREDWIRYWIDVHGPLAHGIPEFTRHYGKYVHNYVLPSPIGDGGEDPDFDGIVEEWLESVDEFVACLREPKYLEVVQPDEVKFVDFARSHMLLTEEHVVHDG